MKPRYCPRDFCLEPEGFGKVRNVRWRRGEDQTERVMVRAAQLQHLYACRIGYKAKSIAMQQRMARAETTDEAQRPDPPLRTLAIAMGCSYARLLRCLRGEIVMRLDDIAWADLILKDISELSKMAAAQQRGQTPAAR